METISGRPLIHIDGVLPYLPPEVPEESAELMNRADVAGKLFDPVHTVLAFDKDFRTVVNALEAEMDIHKISQGKFTFRHQ